MESGADRHPVQGRRAADVGSASLRGGIPHDWSGPRRIIHYTSNNLWEWRRESILPLSSERVIDACVHRLPDGRWRLWYKMGVIPYAQRRTSLQVARLEHIEGRLTCDRDRELVLNVQAPGPDEE